jgi:hypothetical protein
MSRKIVYLENYKKWILKEDHAQNAEIEYKESPEEGW